MMKKALLVVLALCLTCSFLTLAVGAEDAKTVFGTTMTVGTFVSLCIAAALLIILAVVCIIKREKVKESLKAYKSEMKKITWYSWKNVVRGTVFVLVCVLVIGVIVGLLDFSFFKLQSLAAGSNLGN